MARTLRTRCAVEPAARGGDPAGGRAAEAWDAEESEPVDTASPTSSTAGTRLHRVVQVDVRVAGGSDNSVARHVGRGHAVSARRPGRARRGSSVVVAAVVAVVPVAA